MTIIDNWARWCARHRWADAIANGLGLALGIALVILALAIGKAHS